MNLLKLRLMLEQFLLEDIGDRDLSASIFNKQEKGSIIFIAKEQGIFAGGDIIRTVFSLLDSSTSATVHVSEGGMVEEGQKLAVVEGQISELLKGERVALNLVQRMSGIATVTREAVDALGRSKSRITDTRKTTPGLRMIEKYAVRCGGGVNHRYGLYDAVMIKDNHIAFAGSITEAISAARKSLGHMVKIEVETETEEQVAEAVEAGVDCIMFDNRKPEEIQSWIKRVPHGILTEASGGISFNKLPEYGETGVNYISLGYITHSAAALDISVKVEA
ncbi:carboxylating nicotinate-nucleotide diphosphorylase [Bacillus massilinigeriensis]|uniref:carboxylating nicotinate-nucleotide diphosphorylase n=1 Tax=Bacillus mediterraneensis TaxID=1805474 RepID=UPI0008F8F164|nr:carboxylating nicotinate-nucleotide diphosphorylase [Bacillus mediterraneensis]